MSNLLRAIPRIAHSPEALYPGEQQKDDRLAGKFARCDQLPHFGELAEALLLSHF